MILKKNFQWKLQTYRIWGLKNCSINQNNNDLIAELNLNILKKATRYQRDLIEKNKKENPYTMSTPTKGSDKPKK